MGCRTISNSWVLRDPIVGWASEAIVVPRRAISDSLALVDPTVGGAVGAVIVRSEPSPTPGRWWAWLAASARFCWRAMYVLGSGQRRVVGEVSCAF